MKTNGAATRSNRRILADVVAVTMSFMVLAMSATAHAQARSPAPVEAAAVEVDGLRDLRPPVKPKPPLQAPSLAYGVDVKSIVQVGLGPVDVAALLEEDAARARLDKVLRYGVGRDIVVGMADGRWHEVPGEGSLWVVDVVAEAANGIRLHFVDVDMSPGAQLFVYAIAQPERLAGPYSNRGIHGDGQFWTPTRFGERLRVEYFVPSTVTEDPRRPAFAIDRIQHIYHDSFGANNSVQTGGSPQERDSCDTPTDPPNAPAGGSRSGACDGGGCTSATTLYPDTLFSTTSSDWTTFTTCAYGGEHSRFWVESGHTYEWSACTGDGDASCSWDSQFMLRDTSGNNICYNDDWCGTQSKIRWMATFTGEVHLARLQYECTTNDACATLVWREAPCRIDLTCYPAWDHETSAVGGIGYIDSDSLYCSGQLINNLASDWTPYWLTANHCLNTQAKAQSAEIYWLYQSATCNGAPPALSSVPQSAVCTLLATGMPTDYTLLMVDGELPTGLWWAGWTAAAIADGTAAGGIHHPAGSHKQISFGSKSSTTSTHHWINWSDGGTEGGSSGSGIFTQSGRQLFGQLSGNVDDCYFQDNYGAFSVTYPDISNFMAGGSDDVWEQNDSCADAVTAGSGSYPDLIVKGVDEDWYKIGIPTAQTLDVHVAFTDVWGDIDIELYDVCDGALVASSATTTDNESLSYQNCGSTAYYYLRVLLYSDQRNGYSMTIGFRDGEHCSAAPSYDFDISPAIYWQTTGNVTVCTGGCRVYRVWLDCAYDYDFSICAADAVGGSAHPGDGDFTMYDSAGTELWRLDGKSRCNYDASTLDSVHAGWSPPSSGYYYLKVHEYNGGPVTYNLAYKYSAPDPCSSITAMSDGVSYSGTLGPCGTWYGYDGCEWYEAGQEKVHQFSTTVPGVYTLTAEQTAGDVDFFLMSHCNPSSTNIMGGCWPVGTRTLTLPAGEVYYWIVDNFTNSGIPTAEYRIQVDYPPDSPPDPVVSSYSCGETVIAQSGSPPSGVTWYWQATSCRVSTDLGSGSFYSVTSPGTYYIRARHNTTGEWSAACGSLYVNVNMPPADPNNAAANPSTVCAGGVSTLSASVDGAEIDWYLNSCMGPYIGTGANINVAPTSTSAYFARARIASTDCKSAGCDSVTVTVIPTGGACGSQTDTTCDNPNTCDGNGTCLDNYEPTTTLCREDAGDCDIPEYCDGAGACPVDGFEPVDALCGEPTNTICDHPDSCNGYGGCLKNYEQQGTPCLDELFCNGEEACDGVGNCQAGIEPCADPLLPFCDEEMDVCVDCLEIGDVTGDGEVGLEDFAAFAGSKGCQTGPSGPVDPPLYPPECQCLDADDDGDIDLGDFASFQQIFESTARTPP